jgi:hypothetical protein
MRGIYEGEHPEDEELRGEVRQSLALVGVVTLLVLAGVVMGFAL